MDIRGKTNRLLVVLLALLLICACRPQETPLPTATIEQKTTATVKPDDPTPVLTSPLVDWPAEAIELPFAIIEQKNATFPGRYEGDEPKLVVVAQPGEVSGVADWVSETAREQIQATDYNTHLVLAVFRGRQPDIGYGVLIERIGRIGSEIRIYARFEEPQPVHKTIDAPTYPYCVVQVEKVGPWDQSITFSVIVNGSVVVPPWPDPFQSPISPLDSPLPTPLSSEPESSAAL